MAQALWIQSVTGTALRLSQVTHLIPRATDPRRAETGKASAGFELAVSVGGATPVVVAAGLPELADAEAARDGLIEMDDETPGKLIYAQGRWAREEKRTA